MAAHPQCEVLSQPLMVEIPAGWFLMGCEVGQDNEKPVRRVWVDTFLLSATQVTNAEYSVFLRETLRAAPPFFSGANFRHFSQPVVGPSWFDANAYCDWLSLRTGNQYRLPTEAEWERAARGGIDSQLFPWGDEPAQLQPNYGQRWRNGPDPVAQQSPNAFGLYDICENVHEWCSDWYAPDYYFSGPSVNPRGPDSGTRRSSRGGSWRHHVKISRCAARSSIPPDFKYADYGFRIACDVVPRTT